MIAAIISAVVAIGLSVTSYALSAKAAAKPQIDSILYDYVYLRGVSLESMKNAYIKLYRNNKKYFEQQYTYWIGKREQDLANGTHEQQKKINQNRTLSIILFCMLIVFIFLIYRSLKK